MQTTQTRAHSPLTPPVRRKGITEREFLKWYAAQDETVHAEWANGEIVLMSPENTLNANIAVFLTCLLDGFAKHGDAGVVLADGIQLRLPKVRARREADLIFIARQRAGIVMPTFVDGAPDIVFEIVSPDSTTRDYREKYLEYQKSGVREYWIVDPMAQRVEAYALSATRGYSRIPETDDTVRSRVLPGFYVEPAWLWQRPLPNWLKILKEMGVR